MNFRALGVALVVLGLGACTTVDLSQISANQEQAVAIAPQQNVVERASNALTSMFRGKGWCKGSPQEKTQTATSVLLNGVKKDSANQSEITPTYSRAAQLQTDMVTANEQVIQTTKAAEVYLSMADEHTELGLELSSLETALLSAREAQLRFGAALEGRKTPENTRAYNELTSSVDTLKIITDAYGNHLRRQIAAGSVRTRS